MKEEEEKAGKSPRAHVRNEEMDDTKSKFPQIYNSIAADSQGSPIQIGR